MSRRPTREMRRDLAQLVCAAAGLVLGLLVPLLHAGPQVDARPVVSLLFTLGFGVISLVSIIYSMLFLVVQFSASTFTPRLGLFRDEPIVWRLFAFSVGVFVFCISAALVIGARDRVSLLVPCAAVVLSLTALALMRTLQMRAFGSIQLGHALTAITTRAHQLFDTLYVRPYAPDPPAGSPPTQPPEHSERPVPEEYGSYGSYEAVAWPGPARVLQQIDVPALVLAARRHDCAVDFRVAPGRTVSRGMALAAVTGAPPPSRALRDAVVTGLVTGVERTFDQDPELPFRLLADIALRALSAAVNDPATAVDSMDRLEDLLTRLADRDLDVGRFADEAGRLRVTVPVPGWEQYVRTAVDDVAFAAAGSPMALRRMRDLLGRLLEAAPEDRRPVLRERLQWVERTGSGAFPLVWTSYEDGGRAA
ncbi:DUF2254 family protein [Streptomyces sp. NBC_00239]|uniref:DUF2254 family protein n=1 Tax=Streptomyces sp. NBC_00239 TaxID=2903640 RepID=UPI002E29877A|nr:DUF2254 family protein [Streptomyces sp. NBC_00239]